MRASTRIPVGRSASLVHDLRLLPFLFVVLLVLWVVKFYSTYQFEGGLFTRLGVDYSNYISQAMILRHGDARSLYDLDELWFYKQRLVSYTNAAAPLDVAPVPYPPLWAGALQLFTFPPPPVGFALWTGLNLAAALWLAWRVGSLFPSGQRHQVSLLLLVSAPVGFSLWSGQPMTLLACAVGELYLALRAGRDVRAGLWLGCLLIKPHYALLLVPLLVWKRRWAAVLGAAAGAGVLLIGSAAVVGVPALVAYPASFAELGDMRGLETHVYPEGMTNWRRLVLWLAPEIADTRGLYASLLLGALTVVGLVPVWRGRWAPRDPLFPARMTLLLLATVLANYHSHAYGLLLLALPVGAWLASGRPNGLMRLLVTICAFGPAVAFAVTPSAAFHRVALALTLLLVGFYIALLVDVLLRGRLGALADQWVRTRLRLPEPLVGARAPTQHRVHR